MIYEILTFSVIFLLLFGRTLLPSLGRSLGRNVSHTYETICAIAGSERHWEKLEKSIGIKQLAQLTEATPSLTDQVSELRVERILVSLSKQIKRKAIRYSCVILNGDEINAYALPDRKVVVRGKLLQLLSDDELAFVIAHEVGHIEMQHHRDKLKVEFAGDLVGSMLPPISRGLAHNLLAQQFSQECEYQADAFAINLMRRASFDPEAGIQLLEKLNHFLKNGEKWDLFSTHPPFKNRIVRIKELIK